MTRAGIPTIIETNTDARCRIEAQLARIQRYIDAGKQADRIMLDGDMQTMPDVAAIKNLQHPQLNLWLADSPAKLLGRLKTMPPAFHMRCVLKSSADAENGAHHLYADIQRQADGPLSLLIVEPAHLKDNLNGRDILLQLLMRMMPDPAFAGKRMSCFNVAAQKSGSDCLIFCIDFALKAYRDTTRIDALHAVHHGGHAIGNDAGDPQIDCNNEDTLSVAPARLLPFSFFEHAQSTAALQAAWGNCGSDERVIGQIRKMRAQRALAASTSMQQYTQTSIEQRRRQLLLCALTAFTQTQNQQP
jgi:YopJ family protease